MSVAPAQRIYLSDYSPPPWWVDQITLNIALDAQQTRVLATLSLRRNLEVPAAPLHLDGQAMRLGQLWLDGQPLPPAAYTQTPDALLIPALPDGCTLEIETLVCPADNTALEGLYLSGGNLCTQCEAEGFRRITYFPDRPDVMAVYTVRLEADKRCYPVLLSNGNLQAAGELPGGRHFALWHDPFPKPCYLFALVAGDLVYQQDQFITASGREITLRVYVQAHNLHQCDHAMRSLKKAMRWDERRFGCEYDLDIYMVVAVDDFNMGAMENKGLNIFNARYVLAHPQTATDEDFLNVESVIAHEYLHNWSGNRITCRDWFQLSLKEGLTVFRDQEFSTEQTLGAVKRIDDVQHLRDAQFAEDAGPMAHPVRPDSYIEINNFYTLTVYEKGAELVRMLQTLLGPAVFDAALRRYFHDCDGQAVTVEDFIQALETESQRDLSPFMPWYTQAGTPRLEIHGVYEADRRRYCLHITQHPADNPSLQDMPAQPLLIPLRLALFDLQGQALPLRLHNEPPHSGYVTERVLEVHAKQQQFCFEDIPTPPVPSLLRGFSAPVHLAFAYSDAQLAFLLTHDSDPFNRWEAAQRYALRLLQAQLADPAQDITAERSAWTKAIASLLTPHQLTDAAWLAKTLTLPSEVYLIEQWRHLSAVAVNRPPLAAAATDVEAIHRVREQLRQHLGGALESHWLSLYQATQRANSTALDPQHMGQRRLRNLCLSYLCTLPKATWRELAYTHYQHAANMTEGLGALQAVRDIDCPQRSAMLTDFATRWADDPLVMDKWFAMQAASSLPQTLHTVQTLLHHPAFTLKNPNRVRALIGTFANANPLHFHAQDGSGYAFVAEQIIALDPRNPQIAARLTRPLTRWQCFDTQRAHFMQAALQRILAQPKLSNDVYEVARLGLQSPSAV